MQEQTTELYKWYIIHTHSGFEAKVINNIKEEIKKKGLANYFEDFLVPTQKTLEIKKGKKVEGEKKFYPGYILIKMLMNDDAWHLVKKTSKVSGFLGSSDNCPNVCSLACGFFHCSLFIKYLSIF